MQSLRGRVPLFLSVLILSPRRRVFALPLLYADASADAVGAFIPLIAISVSLLFIAFVFLSVKLVYMEQRRIGTIHASHDTTTPSESPLSSSTTIHLGSRIQRKQGNRYRGFLVGLLGSPAWETHLTSKMGRAAWRREYAQPLTNSTRTRSYLATSRDADPLVLASSSSSSHIPTTTAWGSSSTETSVGSARRYPRHGDFGEFHESTRCASPCSVRLVDGPNEGNPVEYSFLSGLPPNAVVASLLMGTRDSLQLSRCSIKHTRKPVPVLPSLLLMYHLPNGSRALQVTEYLPSLHFSPLAGIAKTFYETRVIEPQIVDSPFVTSVVRGTLPLYPKIKSNHQRLQSCRGIVVAGPEEGAVALPWSIPEDEKCTLHSGGPLKSGLRTSSSGMLTPLQTPMSEVDLEMLGLDRFRWNEDMKELGSYHMKRDSITVV